MQTHILNVVKDAPDHRDHLAAPPAPVALPAKVNLRPWLGPIKDQGNLGSCTAHAGTGIREYLYRRFYQWEKDKTQSSFAMRLSPLFLYQMERQIEGTFGQDAGAQSRTIFQALSKYGCALESQDPYVETNAEKLNDSPELMAEALVYKAVSYHRVLDIITLKSVLASGYCATVGMPVFPDFEGPQTADTGKVSVPSRGDSPIGGHEMLVCGYDDKAGAFDVRNSWGADWGDTGHCWVPYNYFAAVGMDNVDFWTCHLGKPW